MPLPPNGLFFGRQLNKVHKQNDRHYLLARRASNFIIGCALLTGCSASKPHLQGGASVVAVAIAPALAPQSNILYQGPATVEAAHTYKLSFEVEGRIATLHAQVGDHVHAGQILATIDPSTRQAQLDLARAQAAAAKASARKTHNGSRPDEVHQAESTVASAQSAAQFATANLQRAIELFDGGAISAQQFDAARNSQRDAQAALHAAQAQLRLTVDGPRTEDRQAVDAQMQAADAQVEFARRMLDKTVMTSPVDAIVEKRDGELGATVNPAAPTFVLLATESPEIAVNIPERLGRALVVGQHARFAVNGLTTDAVVIRIEPQADHDTHTREIRLSTTATLASDFGAVGEITFRRKQNTDASVARIPFGALLGTAPNYKVAIYEPASHRIVHRAVRLIDNEDDAADVSGIQVGTQIVVAGQFEAMPGQLVRVVAKDGAE